MPAGRFNLKLAVFLSTLAMSHAASAQAPAGYPTKPVQMVVSWAVGGSIDTMARGFAKAMGDELGQTFVVENRDGASGMIGTAVTASARPDGYALNFGPVTPITNALHLIEKPAFGVNSLEYVCQVFENRFAFAVPQGSPIKTLKDLLTAIETNPGKLNYGHIGVGSISHLSFETAVQGRNYQVTGVPYRGETPMFLDLMAGRLDFGVVSVGGALATARPVRMVAVIGERRHPQLPDVPTLKELGLPTLQPALVGLMAPKGTPPAALNVLQNACKNAVARPVMQSVVTALRDEIVYLDQKAFTERVLRDYAAKGALVKSLNIKRE